MSIIKIIYRVDQNKILNEIEKEIESFLIYGIESNKKLYDKKLNSLSIRISHRPIAGKRQVYRTIIDTNVELIHSSVSDIMLNLNKKLKTRNINLKNIVSFHLHLTLI